MVCMIWPAMFGNGQAVCISLILMILPMVARSGVRLTAACCGAAHGATAIAASVLPTVAGTSLRLRTATSVFVAPAHHKNKDDLRRMKDEKKLAVIDGLPVFESYGQLV